MSHSPFEKDSEKVQFYQQEVVGDDDVAAKVLAGNSHQEPITEDEEKRLIRKIVTMALQCIDKGLLGAGNVVGLKTDLQLDPNRLANVVMIFNIGMLIGAYPLAALAQKFPIARMTAIYTFIWAVVLFLFPLAHNYGSAMALRFFLGVFEAGIPPAYQMITGMWYTKREQGSRVPFWYAQGFLGLALGYLINSGVIRINANGLARWKFLYIFWSIVTLLWSFVPLFFLPNDIATARFLTDREKYVAVERLRKNHDSIKSHKIKLEHVVHSFSDYKIWLLFIATFTVLIPNYVGACRGLPADNRSISWLHWLACALAVSSWTGCLLASRHGLWLYLPTRAKFENLGIILNLFVCLAGVATLWQTVGTGKPGAVLFGAYANFGFASAYVVMLSFVPSNCGSTTKKSLVSALMLIAYSAGNAAAPQLFRKQYAPNYSVSFKINTALIAVCIGTTALYGFACFYENKKREKMGAEAHQEGDFSDKDDRQNLSFRYAY